MTVVGVWAGLGTAIVTTAHIFGWVKWSWFEFLLAPVDEIPPKWVFFVTWFLTAILILLLQRSFRENRALVEKFRKSPESPPSPALAASAKTPAEPEPTSSKRAVTIEPEADRQPDVIPEVGKEEIGYLSSGQVVQWESMPLQLPILLSFRIHHTFSEPVNVEARTTNLEFWSEEERKFISDGKPAAGLLLSRRIPHQAVAEGLNRVHLVRAADKQFFLQSTQVRGVSRRTEGVWRVAISIEIEGGSRSVEKLMFRYQKKVPNLLAIYDERPFEPGGTGLS